MKELARAAVAEIPDKAATHLGGGPDGICLVRIGDDFYAVADRCTHEDIPLSEGEVDVEECSVECWKHGSTFSLVDGAPQCLPATKPVAVYRVERQGNEVIVSDDRGAQ